MTLEKYNINDKDTIEGVADAYCYACSAEEDKDSATYYNLCHFLYFWIGNLIKNQLGTHKLNDVIQAFYDNLASEQCNNMCTKNIYPQIDKNIFEKTKEIFNYSYNYKTLKGNSKDKIPLCNDECTTYIQEVKAAYSNIQSSCSVLNSGDTFCDEFKNEYKKYFDEEGQKPKLPCEEVSEVEPEDEDESDTDEMEDPSCGLGVTKQDVPTDKDERLKNLPSKVMYGRFKGGKDYCIYPNFPTENIKNKLQRTLSDVEHAETIANGLCYVSTKKWENECDDTHCDPLYFWIGDKLFNELEKDNLFSNVMSTIETELGTIPDKHKCKFMDTDIDQNLFNRRKKIHDYTLNHEKIELQLKDRGTSSSSCDPKYNSYMGDIVTAYNYVSANCKQNNYRGEYCQQFRSKYRENSSWKLSGTKCALEPEEKTTTTASSIENGQSCGIEELQGGEKLGAAPVAVSSVLSVTAIPTVLFFLYKYNLLPSWIRSNTLFGGDGHNSTNNNRNKRSSVRRDLDTLIEDMSKTTTDDDSTIGGSTLGHSTFYSTDDSTLYNNERHRDGGRNIHGHRNVAYHRM
ncbi:KIR protein [Plasmodium coatneyi]|uniref:KIR protein n=1 Tax=Plasmodium coatneyi TaxID=208452 RepID=A0A1B1DYL8_9APIC|nr:KIR protein [Plasmodium coatneyi]ANQ07892.1 KIR protein [Plasmodium coatneyi]